jgi:hypothetical protein
MQRSVASTLLLVAALAAAGCGGSCPAGWANEHGYCIQQRTDDDVTNQGAAPADGNVGSSALSDAGIIIQPIDPSAGAPSPSSSDNSANMSVAGAAGTCVVSDEECDGQDNDCDGLVDENLTRLCGIPLPPCQQGMQTCVQGAWDDGCPGAITPGVETCDGIDNDCNGMIDDGRLCEGTTRCAGSLGCVPCIIPTDCPVRSCMTASCDAMGQCSYQLFYEVGAKGDCPGTTVCDGVGGCKACKMLDPNNGMCTSE